MAHTKTNVFKRCAHTYTEQNKCGDPWYMKKFIHKGIAHQHNVSRWAALMLHDDAITTRTRADEVCDIMRGQIRKGEFVSAKAANAQGPAPDPQQTLSTLIEHFKRDDLDVQLPGADAISDDTLDAHRSRLQCLAAFNDNGTRPVSALDPAAIVAFRTSPAIAQLGRSSWAKYRGIFNRLFRYAMHAGVLAKNPLDKAALSDKQVELLKRRKPEPRTRRLKPGEESRLLKAAAIGRFKFDAQRLVDLIVAALECAGRFGELLALQWSDIHLPTSGVGVLMIKAIEDGASKTGARVVPISDRLKAVLLRRRVNPLTGRPFHESAYVFGNEVGERVTQLRTWEACVVRSEGHTPEYKGRNLSPASIAVYKTAALHFHDLRRECASRWLESKAFTLLEIQHLLGHSNIAQTSEYLALQPGSAIDAMRRYNDQRRQEQRDADVLPVAIGADDYKATANGNDDDSAAPGPRLVKGHKSRERRTLSTDPTHTPA